MSRSYLHAPPRQGRVVDVSMAGLMTSVQEVILSLRHGEKDEDVNDRHLKGGGL
jgi:hypothetical protein